MTEITINGKKYQIPDDASVTVVRGVVYADDRLCTPIDPNNPETPQNPTP